MVNRLVQPIQLILNPQLRDDICRSAQGLKIWVSTVRLCKGEGATVRGVDTIILRATQKYCWPGTWFGYKPVFMSK